MAPSRTGRARSMRRAALLHQAVLARTPAGWVHGQVVEVNDSSVMVQTDDMPPVACRAASAVEIDPVTALLLERCAFGADTPLGDITAIHASTMSRLIGEAGPPRQAPTRDIVRILFPSLLQGGTWGQRAVHSHVMPDSMGLVVGRGSDGADERVGPRGGPARPAP
jgi:hypothetical protein